MSVSQVTPQQSDPFASIAQPLSTPSGPASAPNGTDPFASIAEPAQDQTADSQQPGFWQRAYETSGIKGLVDSAKAKADADKAAGAEVAKHIQNGEWGHALEKIVGHLYGNTNIPTLAGVAKNTFDHGSKAVSHAMTRDNPAEGVSELAKSVPVLGPVGESIANPLSEDIANKNYPGVAGDVTGGAAQIASMVAAPSSAEKITAAPEAAEAAIPKNPTIAGTELPRTVGQAAADANPTGVGSDVKGVEDIARKVPGSGALRDISTEQQAGARQVLTDKAATAVPGQPVEASNAPESIEQNAANAADAARKSGSAKYEELAKEAGIGSGADFTKPVEAAHDILSNDTLAKVLPKSARDALGNVASSLTNRAKIARQIYGKAFGDLDATKQAEVGKAMSGGPAPAAPPFESLMKARSELADAANGMKDPADRFQMHKALDQFDQAIDETLKAHDEVNGSDLTGKLSEGKKLWSQKYAFEEFRDGLQDIMRDQPHTGNREINGAAFQKLINDLDPRGAKGKTTLQRMFPDDPQSVKDIHDLADFMGKNQGNAGGMASGMAKLRLLGLKESAIGLIGNTAGMSWLLSKPGLARNLLTAFTAGKNVAKASAAIGALNHAVSGVQQKADDSGQVPKGRTPVNAPDGVTYHFPDEESARKFRQSAGIQQ